MLFFLLLITAGLVGLMPVSKPPDGPIIMDPPKVRVGDDPCKREYFTDVDGRTVRVWIRDGRGWYARNGVRLMLDEEQTAYLDGFEPGATVERLF